MRRFAADHKVMLVLCRYFSFYGLDSISDNMEPKLGYGLGFVSGVGGAGDRFVSPAFGLIAVESSARRRPY